MASCCNRRVLFAILVIFFIILVGSSELGGSCRPLQDEQWVGELDGLLLQLLPRGPVRPSAPDPIRP
ncbi:hypothetical protein VNO77_16411 [Canavalia gladiata]|uniref:Uncharacterized protein n=1 Tax=Canavalia gladiata TaxID=3824 RepID=A0AAN9QPW4_CANGL